MLKLLGEWAMHGSVLVFFNRQDTVDETFLTLNKSGYGCLTLHGGQDQEDRDHTIDDFKYRKVGCHALAVPLLSGVPQHPPRHLGGQ